MVLATDALHLGWVCACSELTCALSFAIGVRSQGSFDAEVSGVASSPTRPSRSCRSAKHPARSVPLSIDLNLDHEPRKLLSSAPSSRETSLPSLPTSLTVNCELLTTDLQWRFSAPLDQRSPQSPRSTVRWVGRGSRSSRCLVVVVVSLFVLLGRCVAQRAPDGGDFGYFGIDSRPRTHPAGQHGPCAEVRKAAGLTFSRLHFGGFAPRAWRVSAGRLEKNRGFFGIAPARLVLF